MTKPDNFLLEYPWGRELSAEMPYYASYNSPQRKPNLLASLFCRPDPTPSPSPAYTQAYYTPAHAHVQPHQQMYNYNVYSSQGYAPPMYAGPPGAYGGKRKYAPAVYLGNTGSGTYRTYARAPPPPPATTGKSVTWGGASVRRF